MAKRTSSLDRLAALGAHLSARRLEVELTWRGLRVAMPGADPEMIACRARPDDDWRHWFFTSRGEPVAEATNIVEAAVFIIGRLQCGPEGRAR
ncbi:hypothetical protein D0T12_05145 [Actinomadura spongiicola]|uniref:Uncharacterized protein n=1 Tax=Actinomadura spongiicola TaxID=2303421 RepID=A0A372GKY4_9ACTN|nr:hypothetical protein [Actinomadura spongiicola]RFS86020.1 hypothetical protein D0T12_05145 [Actinomadura spongiicola]